jgi:hypothetical protein
MRRQLPAGQWRVLAERGSRKQRFMEAYSERSASGESCVDGGEGWWERGSGLVVLEKCGRWLTRPAA